MIKSLHCYVATVLMLLLLTSCIDDNYDLSDVDTTSRINVNDLVLPVNIDPIRLGDVIEIDDESRILVVNLNGKEFYALVQNGSFVSDPIEIDGVKAVPDPLNPTRETLERLIADNSSFRAPSGEFIFPINEVGNYFSYNSIDIDEAIVSLRRVETAPFRFSFKLEVEDPNVTIASMYFKDMVIRAPKGLVATPSTGTYDARTGYWRIPRVDVAGNHTEISLLATGIDMAVAGITIRPDRSLDFESEFHIESGFIDIEPLSPNFRDEVVFIVSYDLDEFEIKSFDGEVRYALEGIDIAPVELKGIPDFLKGDETEIEIANPQIYLQINNPVASVPLNCSTGLRLTANRDGMPSLPFDLDNAVEIGFGRGESGPYNFVLSPSDENLDVPEVFAADLDWYRFSTLGSLLHAPAEWSVKGLPRSIDIDLVNPGIPVQSVTAFNIPRKLPAAEGKYQLMAPLALDEGSRIIYSEIRDGWNDDDIDGITVTDLQLTAHAVNRCPASIQLTIYPLDKNGNLIDAAVRSTTVAAESESDLVITMQGEVSHLDGIRLVAELAAGGEAVALTPNQTLTLDNIKARVSGYYEKEF